MKKSCMAAIASLVLLSHSAASQATEHKFNGLYDCARKLHVANPAFNIDYDLEFLTDDLFYILDRHAAALYLYTPYFAGKADLSPLMKAAVATELDTTAEQVKNQSFPFTSCCQSGLSYHVRIPYLPGDASKQNGYYYMGMTDSSPGLYDEVYWVREEHKMHIKRHDKPYTEPAARDVRGDGIPRFLSGAPQEAPDFTNYKPKQLGNFWASGDGPKVTGVEYHPLTVEGKLWERNAKNNFSKDAQDRLLADIRQRLLNMPQGHKVGQRSDCWGHAGCDYTYSEEEVAREQKIRDDAINACGTAANEYHLDIFRAAK